MTNLLVAPEWILTHFLRSKVSEVTRTGLSNRQTNTSESFNGDGIEDTFTISQDNLCCVNSVTVGGTELVPYNDYNIDLDNKQVVCVTPPAIGTDNVVIDYDYGSNWVFPRDARDDLTKSSYPRIFINPISENESYEGTGSNDMYGGVSFQIDIMAYKDQFCTIDSESMSGPDVVNYLSKSVKNAIRLQSRFYLKGKFHDPVITNSFPFPFEPDKNIFRWVVEVSYNGNNIGE